MSEEKIESIIRDFVEAYVKGDVEKTLSFLTEDVVWVAPEGTFKGKEELKRLLVWSAQSTPKIRDTGIGICVKGDKAVYEYLFEGTTPDGRSWREVPGICVYEFSGERIRQHRAFFDRVAIVKQATRGWLEKKMLNTFINRAERGLR